MRLREYQVEFISSEIARTLTAGGYLTTDGLGVSDTHKMIADLGFEVKTIETENPLALVQ